MNEKDRIDILQQAVNIVNEHGSIAEASRMSKIPRKTLSARYNKAVDRGYEPNESELTPEQRVSIESKLRSSHKEKRQLEQEKKALYKLLESKQQELQSMLGFKEKIQDIVAEPISLIESNKSSDSTAVMLCSDLHYEEAVDPKTINHLNEYNIRIAEDRLEKFFQNSLKLVEMTRSKSDIENLVLWLGGDFINGYIHEEFVETNAMSPANATLEVYKLLVSGIDFLLEHGGFKKIVIPTNVGNHGRTTVKSRISTMVENSFEWMLYNFLSLHYSDNKRIQIQLPYGYFNFVNIYGHRLRFHHGDSVRYHGGVGGLTIPLNKAIAQWNKAQLSNLDILGHWHQRTSSKSFVVNGSIIGYNAYTQSIKAEFEPPQQSFLLVNSKYGKTVEAPVLVS